MNNVNILLELLKKKEECCGCTACYSICPKDAVRMEADNEGFLYPKIDFTKCVQCMKCVSICAFKSKKQFNTNGNFSNENYPEIFAVKHKDYNIRINSRSGGAFTAISDEIINDGGVVYGCVMADDCEAVHKRAETFEERDNMRGSKYIQSNLGNTFLMAKKDLLAGRKVLFTGTPCQIDGFRKFLNINYDNLLCIDIMCHSVPSPLIWKNYLKWLEDKYNAKCVPKDILFRDKRKYGWTNYVETIKMIDSNNENIEINSEIFKELFYSHYILRPVCYQCPYTSLQRCGDITIADFWGINNLLPGINDNKGVSMVFVNNKKGKNFFNECKESTYYYKVKLGNDIQRPLHEPAKKPENRMQFWNDFFEKGFSYIVENYISNKDEYIKPNKYEQYYYLLNKWVELKQKNINIVQYFEDRNCKDIAIYGMGEVGVRLLEELQEKNINIKYVIDQKNNPLNLVTNKSINKKIEADIVVVTPIFAYDSIKKQLKNYCSCPIVSIEEVIFGFN